MSDGRPPSPQAFGARRFAHQLAQGLHGSVARIRDDDSMQPTLTAQDLVIYSPVGESAELSVGAVVVFRAGARGYRGPPLLVCHRIVRILPGMRLATRGDDNDMEDLSNRVPQEILGVVRYGINVPTGALFTLSRTPGLRVPVTSALLARNLLDPPAAR